MYGGNPIENLSNAASQMALNVAATSIANKDAYKYSTRYADYTNQINLANWRLQNQRNDWLNKNNALIQRNALQAAGLSPASLVDSEFSGAVSDVGAPAAAMSGHSISAPDLIALSMQNKQLAIQQQLADAESKLKDAQTQNVIASTKEIAPNAASQRDLNEAEAAYKRGAVPLNSSMTDYYKSLTPINQQQFVYNFYKFQKDLDEADSRIAANYAGAENSVQQSILAKANAWHRYRSSDAEINALKAKATESFANAGLSDAKAAEVSAFIVPKMMQMLSETSYYNAETGKLKAEKVSQDLQNELTRKYGDAEKIIGLVGEGIGSLASGFFSVGAGVGIAKSLPGMIKGATKITGFGGR